MATQMIVVVTRKNPNRIYAYHPSSMATAVKNAYPSEWYRAYYTDEVTCRPGDSCTMNPLTEIVLSLLSVVLAITGGLIGAQPN